MKETGGGLKRGEGLNKYLAPKEGNLLDTGGLFERRGAGSGRGERGLNEDLRYLRTVLKG